jgi:hypothetical protein
VLGTVVTEVMRAASGVRPAANIGTKPFRQISSSVWKRAVPCTPSCPIGRRRRAVEMHMTASMPSVAIAISVESTIRNVVSA